MLYLSCVLSLVVSGPLSAREGPRPRDGSGTWIAGGQPDPSTSSVVAVIDLISSTRTELCSGVLLAPNVVLTARHCVAGFTGTMSGNVECDTVQFEALRPVEDFRVTGSAALPAEAGSFYRVREIAVPGGGMLCGHDVAILILADSVPSPAATPLVPSFDLPVAGRTYSAVGYGGTGDAGQGAGVRRRRDGLAVLCAGSECGSGNIAAAEFAGDAGVCEGDSGGPALDANQRVLGVASRGGTDCASSVYESAAAQLEFLKTSVRHAAELAGETPPAWTGETTSSSSSEGGCDLTHAGAASPPSSSWIAALLAPAALVVMRRRRPRNGRVGDLRNAPAAWWCRSRPRRYR